MSLIVNGIDIKDILVINSKTGVMTELEKFVDTNGNIIWEKVKEEPATIGLVFSGIDANGNTQYIATSTGEGSSNPSYAYESNPDYNGVPVAYYFGYINIIGTSLSYTTASVSSNIRGFDSNFNEQTESIVVPSIHNGLPVVAVGNGALAYYGSSRLTNLKKITIGENIKTMACGSIYLYANNDIELWLPESLTNLYSQANAADSYKEMQSIFILPGKHKIDVHIKSKTLDIAPTSDSSGSRGSYRTGLMAPYANSDTKNRTLYFEPTVDIVPILSTSSSYFRASYSFDNFIIRPRNKPLTFPTACMPQVLKDSKIFCEEKNKDLIVFPPAGDGSGIAYYKTAISGTLYAENQAFYDYDWGTDNITPTFYKLDQTTLVTRIEQPTISLSDSILTITPPANATKYQIINGTNEVLATTTSTTIDLTQYTTSGTAYTLTVRAFADGLVSSIKSASVSYTAP